MIFRFFIFGGVEYKICNQLTSSSELTSSYSIPVEGKPITLVEADSQTRGPDETRPPSPWSDMTNSSKSDFISFVRRGKDDDRAADKTAFSGHDIYYEQRVYTKANLEILNRIDTSIKRSGLKFRNQEADNSLSRAEKEYQLQKVHVGEYEALQGTNGEHERFRRFLTRLVLRNHYTHNLIERINLNVQKLDTKFGRQDNKELLLQKLVLIVIRAYFHDSARLTTIQRRLINANVVRRNRLIYAGGATKASFEAGEEYRTRPTAKSVIQRDFLTEQSDQSQTQPPAPAPAPLSPIAPTNSSEGQSKAGKSFIAQPATALESEFSITGVLSPPQATKSTATKTVGRLDYPKCPAKDGNFPCPYCPIILTEEYTKELRWRYGFLLLIMC